MVVQLATYFMYLQVVGTLVNAYDTVLFEENNSQSSQSSGALNIESFGQVRVFPQTNMIFNRNVGKFVFLMHVLQNENAKFFTRI